MDRNHDAFRDLRLEMQRFKSTELSLGLPSPLPPAFPDAPAHLTSMKQPTLSF